MAITMQRPLLLVGCGKMGGALLSGWRDSGIAGGGIAVVEPAGVEHAGADVRVVAGPGDLPAGFDPEVVVFAVKPQQMGDVAPGYAAFELGRASWWARVCQYGSIAGVGGAYNKTHRKTRNKNTPK